MLDPMIRPPGPHSDNPTSRDLARDVEKLKRSG